MVEPSCRREPAAQRNAWARQPRAPLLAMVLALLAILAWPGGADAIPQVGVSSFSIERHGGWSDAALGASPALATAAELQAALEVPDDAAARAQDPAMAMQGRGGLSGRFADLLLISPTQALDRWSATCTPDPVTVCREAQQTNPSTIEAAGSGTSPAPGAVAGPGNRLALFAIIAVLLAVVVFVTVVVGRGIVTRRRLGAGWRAPVPS